jgi:hypothetical protein
MNLKSCNIRDLPHELLIAMTDQQLTDWINTNKLYNHHNWLLPQIVAHVANWTPVRLAGVFSCRETMKLSCVSPLDTLCWRLTRLPRSALIKGQVNNAQYSQLVPLLLLAWKQQYGIAYSQWQTATDLSMVLEPKLWEMVNLSDDQREVVLSLGSSELVALRDKGLRNAKTEGQKSATSTWALTGILDTPLALLPKLTQSVLTQIWLAHPTKRNANMILDPLNWDRIPPPLVSAEPLLETTTTPTTDTYKLPWL